MASALLFIKKVYSIESESGLTEDANDRESHSVHLCDASNASQVTMNRAENEICTVI